MTKIAMITGAGTGIGRAVSTALARQGWTTVLVGRRRAPLEEVASSFDVEAQGCVMACDVSQAAQVDELFLQVNNRFGRLDLLFNNAGIGLPSVAFHELTAEQMRTVIEVNLFGAMIVAQGAFRAMMRQSPQGGRIINNGSVSAHVPRPHSAPYTSTKHAISGLTKSLSLDGRRYNIACSQIDIGNAATDMSEAIGVGVEQPNGNHLGEPRFDATHAGDAVAYIAGLPLEANVQFVTLMATRMPYIGRG